MNKKHFEEKELNQFALEESKTIVIRSYISGNSNDTERPATEEEQKIIYAIIFGALLAINSGSNKQDVKNSSEYTGNIFLPNMNGYDTIYNRIEKFNFEV